MQYQRLGKSGLQVSRIVLGCMSYGNKAWKEWVLDNKDEVFELLQYAYDVGLRTWDTANMYSWGDSERFIGQFLKEKKIKRSNITILSKCYFADREFENSIEAINNHGLSRKHIFDAVDASVERLGTYIDVLQIHRFDPNVDKEEIMEALHDVVKSGKVRYIGASSMRAVEFAQLQFIAEKHNWTKFISMQNYYNLLYREEEREMIPFCNETGVGLLPWSPIARGVLARPYGSDATLRYSTDPMIEQRKVGKETGDKEIIDRVEKLAAKKGVSMAQISIAWDLVKGTNPIVGFSTKKRIDDAIGALEITFSEDELNYLEETYVPHQVRF